MNLFKITLYSVLKKDFFDLLYNINCDAREYVGCTNVKKYFDIEGAEKEELVDVGLGVKISIPIAVVAKLARGGGIFASMSHKGVLVISHFKSGNKIQLTDFANERQIEVEVEQWTNTGFYDESMVMLTGEKQLRVCPVEEMFLKQDVSLSKSIGDIQVLPHADVSLLHSTRVLIFNSKSFAPHEFNVDTETVRELDFGKKTWVLASLTGIDFGVKGAFNEHGNESFAFTLNSDDSTSLILECNPGWGFHIVIPSSSDPRDPRKAMKIYNNGIFFTDTTERAEIKTPFRFKFYQSIVRLYHDIFLVHTTDDCDWCLVKILVP